ncbi:GNAT family N-acetyltransferase [Planomonospora parontospora]|nr:GNAT family N-acetyltransferase [Planomonospora parontospora]
MTTARPQPFPTATILGYPRIGPGRELKRALESYWDGRSTLDELRRTGAALRERAWRRLTGLGLQALPSNTFSLYDQVLDTALLLGAVPERYRSATDEDTCFAMARGTDGVAPLRMTKWFDTNCERTRCSPARRTGRSKLAVKKIPDGRPNKALVSGQKTAGVSSRTWTTIPAMTSSFSSTPIEIRLASSEDASVLAQLNDFVHAVHARNRPDIFRAEPAAEDLLPIFEAHLAREDVRVFIAQVEGRPIGYALSIIVDRPGDALMQARTFIILEHLAVASDAIRTGVGTALVDAVRATGRQMGCSRLLTEVWDFNTEAMAFYEKAGFVPMRHLLEQPL